MDGGAGWATVHGVTESDTTEQLNMKHEQDTDFIQQFEFKGTKGYMIKILSCKPPATDFPRWSQPTPTQTAF